MGFPIGWTDLPKYKSPSQVVREAVKAFRMDAKTRVRRQKIAAAAVGRQVRGNPKSRGNPRAR